MNTTLQRQQYRECDVLLIPPRTKDLGLQPGVTPDARLAELVSLYLDTMFIGMGHDRLHNGRITLKSFALFTAGRGWIDPVDSSLNIRLYAEFVAYLFSRHNGAYPVRMCSDMTRFLKWAWQNQYMQHIDLSSAIRMPKARGVKHRKPFTFDEYKRLVQAAVELKSYHMLWAIICGWYTGMAGVDVSMMKWASVDMENLLITYVRSKTGSICKVPIMPGSDFHYALKAKEAVVKCDDWPNEPEHDAYFLNIDLARDAIVRFQSAGTWFQAAFKKVRKKAEVDPTKTFHGFRATLASMMANGGMNTAVACQITGHRSPEVFKRYVTTDTNLMRAQLTAAYLTYHGIQPTVRLLPDSFGTKMLGT